MRVGICWFHLEFQDIILKNTENADVLILSGVDPCCRDA
jgi:hypothetical protein